MTTPRIVDQQHSTLSDTPAVGPGMALSDINGDERGAVFPA